MGHVMLGACCRLPDQKEEVRGLHSKAETSFIILGPGTQWKLEPSDICRWNNTAEHKQPVFLSSIDSLIQVTDKTSGLWYNIRGEPTNQA